MINGQERICNKIDTLTLDDFPRSLMLVGEFGSGKHMIVDYVSNKFNLQVIDITTSLDHESIDELYNRVEPYIYIIRANELSVKEENVILKFLEEPLKNSYIIMLAETDIGLLQTILNRCQIWYLQNYTKSFLKQFVTDNEFVLEIANTPGQVIQLNNSPITDMIELADRMLDKIHVASVSNTLSISDKVSFKDDNKKFNVLMFSKLLLNRIVNRSKSSSDKKYYNSYYLTSELVKKLQVKNLDQKSLFEKYLIELRTIMKGES